MSDALLRRALIRLIAKWRNESNGVEAMGYSQQADRMRDCANELANTLLAHALKKRP